MKVSMIIPCYWLDDELVAITERCISTAIDYAGRKIDQIIVVDDGSPIKASFDYPINYVRLKRNQGFPYAVNRGLEKSTGDIIVIGNNDIVFTPNWLDELIKPLHYGFDISSIVTSDQGWETKDVIQADERFGSLWVMKRQVYETLGGLDEQFGTGTFEDADYYLRAKQAGLKIGKNWNCLVEHYARKTFDKIDAKHTIFEKNKERFKQKWGYLI